MARWLASKQAEFNPMAEGSNLKLSFDLHEYNMTRTYSPSSPKKKQINAILKINK